MSIFTNRIFNKFGLVGALACLTVLSACDNKANSDTATPTIALSTALPSDDAVVSALQKNLQASGVNLTVKSAMPTDMPNMYWVMFDEAPPMFVDANGEYIIQGQIAKVGGEKPVDITTAMQSTIAKEMLSAVDKNEMIIYPAVGETKAAVYAFTDPSCHYCQKLHSEIDDITAQGIEVRYLAWPRTERFVPVAEAIWCSADQKDAITRAKKGQNITAPACDNPVAKHMGLGHAIGVSGTPAIFSESGYQIGGYLPADELAKLAIKHR